MVTSPLRLLPVCGCLALALSGCARSATVAAGPPVALNVPPPPPRVISVPPEPVAPVETTTAEPPEERRPAVRRPAARPAAGTGSGAQAQGSEPPAEEAAPAPPAAEPPAPPAPVLRTPQTADESQAASRVRAVLGRATTLLSQVSPAGLSREARSQHDTARRFVEQAEQALIERNFVFASYLADKAETLARGLSR